MRHIQTFQTCSSIIVAGTCASAEIAACLLERFPSSTLAWYLNVAVFGPFEQARAVAYPFNPLVGPATLMHATIFMLLALAVSLIRSRLGIALVAHLAFAVSIDLARAWITSDQTGEACLAALQGRNDVGTCLVVTLLVVSAVACALSHLAFAIAIRADARNETRYAGYATASLEAHPDRPAMFPS